MNIKHETVEAFAEYMVANYEKWDSYWHMIKYPEGERWCVVEPSHRDSDALDRSNYQVMVRELKKVASFSEAPDRFDVVPPGQMAFIGSANHCLVGYTNQIHMRIYEPDGAITPVFKRYYELRKKMADYPVLDDDHFSNLEYEDALASIESVGRSHVKDGEDGWVFKVYDHLTENGQVGDYEVSQMWDEIVDALRELGLAEADDVKFNPPEKAHV